MARPPLSPEKLVRHRTFLTAAMTHYPEALGRIAEMRQRVGTDVSLRRRVELLNEASLAAYQLTRIHVEMLRVHEVLREVGNVPAHGETLPGLLEEAREALERAEEAQRTAAAYQTEERMRKGVLWLEYLAAKDVWPEAIAACRAALKRREAPGRADPG